MKKYRKESKYVVDMHCHIIPGVDDGAKNIEESIMMLLTAEEEGITHLICTPHFKKHHRSVTNQKLREQFEYLVQEAKKNGIKVKLYPGNEFFYFRDPEEDIENKQILSMNGSEYMLVEFHPMDSFADIRNGLDEIMGLGYTPVLAHAERYECIVKKTALAEELVHSGVRIQVNASSVIGDLGFKVRQFTKGLLKKQLVDYIGTDAHSCRSRKPEIQKCRDYLYRKYDESYVDDILYRNAIHDFGLEK